ncbi:MAG: NAD(P)-dependent oxidoreductase [Propionicimonas sp.]|uniref:NAD(P)-dependent oxidoreductase n=1 Tax=Propionicimonas sp. TaxID=1955623 RepID=UPI003D0C882F
MTRIAFLGLGRMGSGMASRLLDAGHDLVVWNRTSARCVPFAERGARVAPTPAEAVVDAEAVFVMVGDDDASRAVWLGADGVLSGRPAAGALAVECSTLSHEWVGELSAAAGAAGLRYVDAPVTGLPDAAAAGRLTLLVGADPDDLAAARPLFEAVSDRVLHFGPVGTGTAYKLIVNLMGAVQIAGAAEGLAMAERAGLDLDQVVDALASGQAASPQVVRNALRMAAGDHAQHVVFSGRLRRKDTDYALRFAGELGIGAAFGRVALDGLDELIASGLGDANESAVIEVARRRTPS